MTEEPQLLPGGPDSVDNPKYGQTPGPPVGRDLPPEDNPAVDDELPEELSEPDDKEQGPDGDASGGHSGDSDQPVEPPA